MTSHPNNPVATTTELPRMDKTALSVASLSDEPDDKAYWLSKTPDERLTGVELMRQIIYGYSAVKQKGGRNHYKAVLRYGATAVARTCSLICYGRLREEKPTTLGQLVG